MKDKRLRRLRDRAGPATLVTRGCKITGHVGGDSSLHLAGEIDGDCDLDGTVTVEKGGLWTGTVRAKHVVVAGAVEGDIIATGRVEIADTARITGTVSGEAIAVAEGAIVEGVMRTTGKDEPTEFVEKRVND